jgi:hypothetical protein
MLAQYAQIMGIKAAQQEMEGSEDVRRYFSAPADQRGDISQIMHTKGGRAASETLSQNAQRELKMELDALGAAKANVYMAKDPAALAEYMKGVYSSPAGKLLSRFVPVDKALAAIPTDPVAFKEYQKNFGLTADQIVTNVTKERGQNMTYGATVRGQDLLNAREIEKREYERKNPALKLAQGENGFYLYNDRDPNSAVPLGMRPPVAAPVAQPSAVNNLMMTTQPTPSINALTQPAPNQAGPTVAAANALNQQPTIIRPKQPFSAPVPVIDKSGNTVFMSGREAIATGATPATKATEDRASAVRALPATISQAKDALNLINRMVGTPDGKSKPHKGFEGAVGAGMGMRFIPGTSARDFQAMHEQITGGAFMQAFETLKGGGQITEKEGEKATAAITRMSLATSEKEYMVAAREFQEVIRRGIQNAEKELRAGPGGGGAPADPLGIR